MTKLTTSRVPREIVFHAYPRLICWVFFLPRVRQRIDEIVEVAPVAALAAN